MKKLLPMILILMLLGACKPGKTVPATVSPPYRQPHLTPFLGPTETTFQLASLTPQSSPSAKAPLIPITSTTAAAVLPNFDHIVLIVLENTDYSVALDSSSMPHLAELAEDDVFGLLLDLLGAQTEQADRRVLHETPKVPGPVGGADVDRFGIVCDGSVDDARLGGRRQIDGDVARPLVVAADVAVGAGLTVSPLASTLGFVPLPPRYWLLLAIILLGYAILTQGVKTWFIRRFGE